MGIIQVNTPSGVQKVNIEGDEPTPEESEAITSFFSSPPEETRQLYDPYRGMSYQEAQAASQGRRLKEGEEEIKPTHGGEVPGLLFQMDLGRADIPIETEARLTRKFGEGTFFSDNKGSYILDLDKISPEIKRDLDLPETGTIYANKPGFSGYDVAAFLGGEAGPILATIGAGMAATGMGVIPGIALMAMAGAAGRAIDEVIVEDFYEGLQRQTPEDIIKASMFEALLVGGSEAVFRGLGVLGRHFIKGKGPTPSTQRIEELTEQFKQDPFNLPERSLFRQTAHQAATRTARDELSVVHKKMIEEGASIPATTISGKAILGRTQAIWESIFPNDALLSQNAAYAKKVAEKVKKGLLSDAEGKQLISDGVQEAVNRVKERLLDPKTAYGDANKRLKNILEKELELVEDVIKQNSIPGTGLATEFQQQLDDAANIFSMDSKALYHLAETELGGLSVSLKPLNEYINKLTARGIPGTARTPLQEINAATVGDKLSGGIFQVIRRMVSEGRELPITDVPAMRAALRATSEDPEIVGTVLDNAIKRLLDDLNGGVRDKTNELAARVAAGAADDPALRAQRNALERLEEANLHYATGQDMINSGALNVLKAAIDQKQIQDMSGVVEYIVKAKKPAELEYYLNALTPSSEISGNIIRAAKRNPGLFSRAADMVETGDISGANKLLRDEGLLGTGGAPTSKIIELPEFYEQLGPVQRIVNGETVLIPDPTRTRLQNKYAKTLRSYDRMATKQIKPEQFKEQFTQLLAREWLSLNTVRETSQQVPTDLVGLANRFDNLGATAEKLFGANYPQVRALMDDFRLIGKNSEELSEAVLTQFNPPAGQTINYRQGLDDVISNFKAQTETIKSQSEDAFLNAVRNKTVSDPDRLVAHLLANPASYNTLKRELGEDLIAAIDEEVLVKGVPTMVSREVNVLDAVKDRVVASLIPESVVSDFSSAVQNGTLGKEILQNLSKANKNGAITNIMGKDFVENMQKFGTSSQIISDSALKGKTGLAAAGYAAAFATSLYLNPLATLGGAALILGLSRTLRSKFIMNSLTNPRIRAYEAERALKAGIDVGKRNLVLEKIRENAYRDMRVILTQLGAYGAEQAEEAASARLAPVMEQVAPVVEEAKQQVQEAVPQLTPGQPLTAVTPGQPPAAVTPGQMTAADVERQRVMNQLVGLPA
jgi:hypothetical protein